LLILGFDGGSIQSFSLSCDFNMVLGRVRTSSSLFSVFMLGDFLVVIGVFLLCTLMVGLIFSLLQCAHVRVHFGCTCWFFHPYFYFNHSFETDMGLWLVKMAKGLGLGLKYDYQCVCRVVLGLKNKVFNILVTAQFLGYYPLLH